MKNVVLNEIIKDLNWRDKLLIKLFTDTFIKVYNIGRVKTFNNIIN